MVERIGFIDADVIIDGAVAETRTFVNYDDGRSAVEYGGTWTFDGWLASIQHDAETEGFYAEVYTLYHEHELAVDECSCSQYVTDGRPAFTYGEAVES